MLRRSFRDSLGDDLELERFWDEVEQNLRSGRVRLVFVSDVIPPELRRVIEFLNERMSPTEVVGVEIKQYVGHGNLTNPGAADRRPNRASANPEDRRQSVSKRRG
jgi:hypothetical protein